MDDLAPLVSTVIQWEALGIDPKIIVENSERIPGRFIPSGEISDEPVAVVAYGPSLKNTWEKVGQFKTIFTCSGAHKFLIDRGIIPTFHCESDPRGHKVAMLGEPHPDVTYLIASVCAANYFDTLLASKAASDVFLTTVKLWHILFEDDAVWKMVPKGDWVICGGDTIGPRTIKLARLSGYTNLHLFGFDGSGYHAGPHTNSPPAWKYNEMKVSGVEYTITEHMWYHLKVFFDDLDRMPEVKTTFYGEGLIQAMARRRTPANLKRVSLAVQKWT